MDSSLVCHLLSDPTRQKILHYVNRHGRTLEGNLVLAINGRGVDEETNETHIPLLVDYGILKRDGEWVYPTSDSFLLAECLDSLEATLPESTRSTPVESAR